MKQVKTILTLILVILVLASMYSFMRDEKIKMAEETLEEIYTIDDLQEVIDYRDYLNTLNREEWIDEFENGEKPGFFGSMTERCYEVMLMNRFLDRITNIAIDKSFEMKVTNIELTEDFYREADESGLHEFTRQGYDYKVTIEINYLEDGSKETVQEKGKIAFRLEDKWLIDVIKVIDYSEVLRKIIHRYWYQYLLLVYFFKKKN